MTEILQTQRLALREMTLDELDFIADLLAHPDVMRFYPKCYSRDEAEQWVDRQLDRYARDGCGLWLASLKESGEPVGQVGLVRRVVEHKQEIEVGYLIHLPYWRRGYATEAAAACRDYAFDQLDEPRLIALIRPENLPSQGVARKLGMSPGQPIMHANLEHIVFSISRDLSDY